MSPLRYDVVVSGAGPSGSMAARAAAEQGAAVVLIEEHPQVGIPVSCAEGLSLNGLRDAGIEPTPEVVSQEVARSRIYAPNGKYLELSLSGRAAYTINRDVFDRVLSERAVEAGAELMTGTKVTGVLRENGVISGVFARQGNETLRIEAKVVIGADGYASTVRRTAGLGKWYPDVVTCAQYKLGGLELEEPEIYDFYLGREVAPGGYAWVFPKSAEVANVGLGVRKIHTESPIKYLKRFVANDPRFKDAEIQLVNGGICPVSGVLETIVSDGLMLTGDSAGQLVPFTGAGVHTSIVAGRIAGEVAACAVDEGDVSASRLSEYERRFDALWGKQIKDSRKVINILDRFNDDDLNSLLYALTSEDILDLVNGIDITRVLGGVAMRSPLKFMRLMASYLRG
jgi:digeranylgeranylglycerophospholipid reductase